MSALPRLWLAALVAGLIAWTVAAATTRAHDEALNALRDYPFVQDPAQREDIERAAATLVGDELARRRPDQRLIAVALVVLRQTAGGETARARVESGARARLDRELARSRPDAEALSGAYGLLALAGAEDAREQLARIAALAGDRGDAARALSAAAARLREAGERGGRGADGDAALAEVLAQRARLLGPAGGDAGLWAVRESPQVATALEDAAQAALIHFESLVAASRCADAPASADPAALDRGLVLRLRAGWEALQALGIADRCDAQTVARYAQASRRRRLEVGAWLMAAVLGLAFPAAAVAALVRLRRGPSPIDPGAETIENESPIDLDTEAETLEAARSGRPTGAGETTMP